MEILRALPVLLLGLLAAGGAAAEGREVSFEWGQCRFGVEADGTFYQSDRNFRNYMTPNCGSLAIADRFGEGPLGWRVAFVTTGSIQARDTVTTVFDTDAFQHNLTCNNVLLGGQGCEASINGHGHTWGFSFAGTYQRRFGILTATVEAGLFFFRHSFHAQFKHIDCSNCLPLGVYDESSGPFTTPTPLAGLTLKVGHLYVAARYYWPAEHRALSLTDHSFTQLSTGLAVRY